MNKHPREEQETIVLYDVEESQWNVYTDYPPHIRKILKQLGKQIPNELPESVHEYIDPETFNTSFSIKKKREMTDEQRKKVAERMRNVRK